MTDEQAVDSEVSRVVAAKRAALREAIARLEAEHGKERGYSTDGPGLCRAIAVLQRMMEGR